MSGARARVAIAGVTGKMGQAIMNVAAESHDLDVISALARSGHGWIGRDLGVCLGRLPMGVPVIDDPNFAFDGVDVVVDFTQPASTLSFLPFLQEKGVALVCGNTGFREAQWDHIQQAAQHIAIVHSPNMSLGMNVLIRLVREAAALLGDEFDAEVLEIHHRQKKDAPSGTAINLADVVAQAKQLESADALRIREWGITGSRSKAEVGIGVLRGGDVVGEHSVLFLGTAERLTLSHLAVDRRAFARGALRAVHWVKNKPPGLYHMQDVLSLRHSI